MKIKLLNPSEFAGMSYTYRQPYIDEITDEIIDTVNSINKLIVSGDLGPEEFEDVITSSLKGMVMTQYSLEEWYRVQRDNLLLLKGIEAGYISMG